MLFSLCSLLYTFYDLWKIKWKKIIKNVNETFDRFSNVGPWFLRITLGISFLSFGYAKFPLPSEMLVSFGFTKLIAVFVPLVEVIGGIGNYSDWFYERIIREINN